MNLILDHLEKNNWKNKNTRAFARVFFYYLFTASFDTGLYNSGSIVREKQV